MVQFQINVQKITSNPVIMVIEERFINNQKICCIKKKPLL